MSEVEDKMAVVLAQMWQKNRPIVEERLAVLDRASAAAAAGGLSTELRGKAAQAAHKLAGALGMYGYEEGTLIAREMDALLSSDMPVGQHLGDLTVRLRAAVFPEHSTASY